MAKDRHRDHNPDYLAKKALRYGLRLEVNIDKRLYKGVQEPILYVFHGTKLVFVAHEAHVVGAFLKGYKYASKSEKDKWQIS